MSQYKGIDISKHNIVTSWNDIKRSGIDFVIVRAGGDYNGKYKDSKFEKYYDACKNYNIPVGCYYDAGKEFYTTQKGYDCAAHFLQLMSGKTFEYPVFLDIEVTPKKYRKLITDATVAFCRLLEDNGYYAGIYASDISGFKEMLESDRLVAFDKWVARYGGKMPSYIEKPGIWQFSSKGSIPGITGNVDLDISYKNYPKIIKGGHFNGY